MYKSFKGRLETYADTKPVWSFKACYVHFIKRLFAKLSSRVNNNNNCRYTDCCTSLRTEKQTNNITIKIIINIGVIEQAHSQADNKTLQRSNVVQPSRIMNAMK